MRGDDLLMAKEQAYRFVQTVEAVLARYMNQKAEQERNNQRGPGMVTKDSISYTAETAACRRASMDLTRELAKLRRSM